MKACKAGGGNPKCDHKRNAKGTPMYNELGLATSCAYSGECIYQIEVQEAKK